MRLIDADAIRELLIKYIGLTNGFDRAFSEAPSIEIVRCKECKFWAGNSDGDIDDWVECRWREDEAPDADDFCSYGERRE